MRNGSCENIARLSGIDLDAIIDKLRVNGVASFASAYTRVLDPVGKKLREIPQYSHQV
jgi:hypothetical protein